MLSKAICRLSPRMTHVVARRGFEYGVPLRRISLLEKCFLYSISLAIITGPMFYIMGNLKKYQKKDE